MARALDLGVRRFLSGPWEAKGPQPQPHDVDVKGLPRIAVVLNCPMACDRATADFLLSSPLMHEPYDRVIEGFDRFAS